MKLYTDDSPYGRWRRQRLFNRGVGDGMRHAAGCPGRYEYRYSSPRKFRAYWEGYEEGVSRARMNGVQRVTVVVDGRRIADAVAQHASAAAARN